MRVSESERVRFHDRGRICAEPGCATILSVYDPAKYCAAHLRQAPRRLRIVPAAREVSCESCGTPFVTSNPRRSHCSDRCRMPALPRRSRARKRVAALEPAVVTEEGLLGSPA